MSDTLDIGGGSGGRSFPWGPQGTQPGARVAGRVLALAEVQSTHFDGPLKGQPETWDNGDPKMQYRVTLQTDLRDPADQTDDGVRDVYLDGARRARDNGTKSRLCAVLDAVREVTGGTQLAVGGYLEVQWISGMGFSGDPRNYSARYQAPGLDLGGQAAQAAPAQQVVSQPPYPSFTQQTQVAPPATVTQPANPLQAAVQAPAVEVSPSTPQYVNRATGEIATPEQVAAITAAGMDPAAVFAVA